LIRNAPRDYESLLAPLPEDVQLATNAVKDLQMVHFFTRSREELESQLPDYIKSIRQDGMIWVGRRSHRRFRGTSQRMWFERLHCRLDSWILKYVSPMSFGQV
jgi:hypothetical protein